MKYPRTTKGQQQTRWTTQLLVRNILKKVKNVKQEQDVFQEEVKVKKMQNAELKEKNHQIKVGTVEIAKKAIQTNGRTEIKIKNFLGAKVANV